MQEDNPRFFTPPGNLQQDLIGGTIEIGSINDVTISPDRMVHAISGDGSIATINPPWPDFVGPLYLISLDEFSFTDNGNVNIPAGMSSIVENTIVMLIYNRKIAKWYTIAGLS